MQLLLNSNPMKHWVVHIQLLGNNPRIHVSVVRSVNSQHQLREIQAWVIAEHTHTPGHREGTMNLKAFSDIVHSRSQVTELWPCSQTFSPSSFWLLAVCIWTAEHTHTCTPGHRGGVVQRSYAYCLQYILQAIKKWMMGRPGNEANWNV